MRKNRRLESIAAAFLRGRTPSLYLRRSPGFAFEELSCRPDTWSRPRRVVVVYDHRPGEFFANLFPLITNWSVDEVPPEALLPHYRCRYEAEGHYGEFKSVLAPGLSSTRRPKSHYRGKGQRSARSWSPPSR